MDYETVDIETVAPTLIRDKALRDAILDAFDDPKKVEAVITTLEAGGKLPEEHFDAYDLLHDAYHDTAPDVEDYDAEQDKGVYSVAIRGIKGAYFITAIEYDDVEYFETLKGARDYLHMNWGEFLV